MEQEELELRNAGPPELVGQHCTLVRVSPPPGYVQQNVFSSGKNQGWVFQAFGILAKD